MMKKVLDTAWEKQAQLKAVSTGMPAAYISPFSLRQATSAVKVTSMEAARNSVIEDMTSKQQTASSKKKSDTVASEAQ